MATETTVEVVMPQMGVSVSEGTIIKWLKQVGERVEADEPLLEISTDKVDTEVPSPASGILTEITAQEGETVEVGTGIAVISSGGGTPATPSAPQEPATAAAAVEVAAASSAETAPATAESVPAAAAAPSTSAETTSDGNGRSESGRFVSPVVARIAAEHGVDVGAISGTGRGGRVTKKDILAYVEATGATPVATPPPAEAPAPTVPAPAPGPAAEPTPAPGPVPAVAAAIDGESVEAMSAIRRGIAEHMRRSLDTSAHVTTVFEVDLSRVVAIRNGLKQEFDERHGVKLTYLGFIARATVDTLAKWPWLNAEIRGDQIVSKSFVNLGIAVALDGGKGLIVPVIRNAEDKNLLGIARAIQDLGERARTKKLLPDDVQAGTFTITNPGGFGEIMGTPVISQPQVGILDTAALVKRPVVIEDEFGNDAIAIRPMMNLCLSFDHRLVDGAYAGQFMRDLKTALESWNENDY